TCKIEITGLHHLEQMGDKKGIVMLWHNSMVVMCEFFKRYLPESRYAAFLSKSRDGEPIARAINSYRNGHSIRVAHNLKHEALRSAITFLNEKGGLLLITPDGPKGPRCKIKPGIVLAAKETEAPIFAFSWEADRVWELNSWDKLRIPKPFSTVKINISSPIVLDKDFETSSAIALLESQFYNVRGH
ncbi:MAG: DUF374 domain-containing protein, partial [Nitrosopumilus sp.]|nr:DUF374 domain-containing protein [Nitrosopumilus sp.]